MQTRREYWLGNAKFAFWLWWFWFLSSHLPRINNDDADFLIWFCVVASTYIYWYAKLQEARAALAQEQKHRQFLNDWLDRLGRPPPPPGTLVRDKPHPLFGP